MRPRSDEFESELAVLRRHNETLYQLVEQAMRMGEKLLEPARVAVSPYREYVELAGKSDEAAEAASRRLAAAMDKLSRLVVDAKQTQVRRSRKDSPTVPQNEKTLREPKG